jgi:beta-RFAP synthase
MNDSPANDAHALPGQSARGAVVRIQTGSRLHFGLLDTAAPFGGLGVMIQQPQTEVVIRPSARFRCADQIAHRIEPIARRIQQLAGTDELPRCEVDVVDRAHAHWGLGSGTQLAMAVAEGLAHWCGLELSQSDLALRIAGRGKRSAVGIHGYFQGGLIYEDADRCADLNPIQTRVALPAQWCVVLCQPASPPQQVSGDAEQSRFKALGPGENRQREYLRAILTDQLLPAAQQGRFADFAAAVSHYNHQSGLLFAAVQGGPYNGAEIAGLIDVLVGCGAVGVGQSSWGPSVFSWFENLHRANDFLRSIPPAINVLAVSPVLNCPRRLSAGGSWPA